MNREYMLKICSADKDDPLTLFVSLLTEIMISVKLNLRGSEFDKTIEF